LGAHASTETRAEYLVEPNLIDTPAPRFFWLPQHPDRGQTQSAYHVVVTADSNSKTVWDSGSVASNASAQVEYAGAALTSDSCYSWTVAWSDNTGTWAPASAPAHFCTGLLTQAEWVSDWISCPQKPGAWAPGAVRKLWASH
jgi:alpha-L-rhamnosidase